MESTYLTTEELSEKIKYDPRTIRERLKDSVLHEGVHYVRPFGGRKILYLWERIVCVRPSHIDRRRLAWLTVSRCWPASGAAAIRQCNWPAALEVVSAHL